VQSTQQSSELSEAAPPGRHGLGDVSGQIRRSPAAPAGFGNRGEEFFWAVLLSEDSQVLQIPPNTFLQLQAPPAAIAGQVIWRLRQANAPNQANSGMPCNARNQGCCSSIAAHGHLV
jgi:hypothetical protein